jgi:hypothetical protein
MPESVELADLHHALSDLRAAVASLRGKYGDAPTVLRLRNDLERLEYDVADVPTLGAVGPGAVGPAPIGPGAVAVRPAAGEPHDAMTWGATMWGDDAGTEGVAGFHVGGRR